MKWNKLKITRNIRLCRGIMRKRLIFIGGSGLMLILILGFTAGLAQIQPLGVEAGPIVVEKAEQNEAIRVVVHSYSLRAKKLGDPAPEGKVFLILRGTLINKLTQKQMSVPDVQNAFSLQLIEGRTVSLHPLSEDTADPFWGPIILEPGENLPVEMVFSVPARPLKQASLIHLSSAGSIHIPVIGQPLAPHGSHLAQPVREGPSGEITKRDEGDVAVRPKGQETPKTQTKNEQGEAWKGSLLCPAAPFAHFAYVANFDDHTISAYTVDTETGALRHNGYVFSVSGRGPFWVTADPKGRFLFVANIENRLLSVYKIHARTGALKYSASIEVEKEKGEYPSAIAIHPAGKFLYVANEKSDMLSIYVINQRTGALRLSRTLCTGKEPSSLTIDPQGRFLYAINRVGKTVSLYQIDPRYGAITTPEGECGDQFSAGKSPTSLAVNPEGTFAYVADTRSNAIFVYTVDQITGKLKQMGDPVPVGVHPVWVAIHPSGRMAYVANMVSNDISIFRVLRNGGLINQTTIDAEAGPQSIILDPRGSVAYVTNRDSNHVSMYRIDPKSGLLENGGEVTARSWPRSLALLTGREPILLIPKFVYVWGYDTRVAAFSLDVESGRLRKILGSPFTVERGHVAIHPSGTFAYRLHHDAISVYTLDRHTGDIIFKERTPFDKPNFTGVSLSVDPSGRWAYVTGHQFDPRLEAKSVIFVFTINPDTGSVQAPGGPALVLRTRNLSPVLVDPSGKFAFVTLWQEGGPHLLAMHTVDAATGSLSPEPTSTGPRGYRMCGFHPSGSFVYAVKEPDAISVFLIEGETGTLRKIQSLKGGEFPWCLTMHPSGSFAYAVESEHNTIVVYKIDPSTGRLVGEASRIKTRPYPIKVTVDPTGQFVFVIYDDVEALSVYRVDQKTGALTEMLPRLALGFEPDTITFRLGTQRSYD